MTDENIRPSAGQKKSVVNEVGSWQNVICKRIWME
jgi:hypothetical protein